MSLALVVFGIISTKKSVELLFPNSYRLWEMTNNLRSTKITKLLIYLEQNAITVSFGMPEAQSIHFSKQLLLKFCLRFSWSYSTV